MRSYIPDYSLVTPVTLQEALELLAREPGVWKAFAGGTDLMVMLEAGKLPHKKYLNIWSLKELSGIQVEPDYVNLGALTTYTEVMNHSILKREFPMLCQAAGETGGPAIQNRGTLGGNIINASPAADSPPALLAYDAEIELISVNGGRWVSYLGFHTNYKEIVIRPDELLSRIRLPRVTGGLAQYYRKIGTRKAQAISKICLAATGRLAEGRIADLRIAFGSVAPIPIRCLRTEDTLRGRPVDAGSITDARASLAREISPITDIRSTKDYRLRVSENLLEDFLQGLAAGETPSETELS